MVISSARATFGLLGITAPTSNYTAGAIQIGNNNVAVPIALPDSAYCVRAIFSTAAEVMTLNLLTGTISGATFYIPGVAQVATATAAGTVTVAGNASMTLTAAGLTGSPKAISFAVAVGDTPTLWAVKARAALNADAAVAAMFTASGSGAAIVLTRKPVRTFALPVGVHSHFAANDATVNLALATGTATGITAAPTSAATTAGVITSGVRIFDDLTDFEGILIASLAPKAVLYSLADRGTEVGAGRATVDGAGPDFHQVPTNGSCLITGNGLAALNIDTTSVVTAVGGFMDFSATVIR